MRITTDTNVLISALGWNGPEARVASLVMDGVLELCLSAAILEEFYTVCRYAKFAFSPSEIDGFIGRLMPYLTLVSPDIPLDIIEEDPADNRVLACALAGKTRYIISGDRHLLTLGCYGGVEILRAPDFLAQNCFR